MAIKRLFRTVKKAAGAPGSYIGGKFADAKVRASKKRSDQIVEDVKVLRGVRESERSGNSRISDAGSHAENLRDPNSLTRRKMRVDEFKQEMSEMGKPKRRLFGRK